jgi:dTDP-4-amino-4,6-dideoxygalactose transaminase
VHYKPLHLHPRYAPYGKGQTPVTDKVWPYMLSLPMHPGLSDADAHRVAKTILAYAAKLP